MVSELIAFAVALGPLRKPAATGAAHSPRLQVSTSDLVLAGLFLALFLAIPTNLDVALVHRLFAPEETGFYAATATLGKVIVSLPVAGSFVMLPQVARERTQKLPTRHIDLQSILWTLLLSGPAALLYWLFSERIIGIFFGQPFLGASPLLGWYGLTMMPFALNLLLAQYGLAVEKKGHLVVANSVALGTILTLVLGHPSLQGVVMLLLVGNLFLFAWNCLALLMPGWRGQP